MAFDGIITKAIVNELNTILAGAKINKIFQPSKNELIIDIYNKKKYMLDIYIDSANCRINLTTHLKNNPKTAPNFCMLLRKYLTSSKILSIETKNLDRIICINLETYNELNDLVKYKLIVELMGKHSNVILVNSDNIIIDSLRHISSEQSLRTILPANPYVEIESNKLNILEISKEHFINNINTNPCNNLLDYVINNYTGISKSFVTYTLEKLNIDSKLYTKDDIEKLYKYLISLLSSIDENKIACVSFDYNSKYDYVLAIDLNNSKLDNINSFIDSFYFNKEQTDLYISYRNTILKLILSMLAKNNKKLSNIEEKLKECRQLDKYKLYGELITANLYKINNKVNIDKIELENYYENNKLITIPLDKKISPSNNAKKYFKKYDKLKNTLIYVTNQKTDIEKEILYLESIIYSIENSSCVEELNEIQEEIENNLLGKTTSLNNKNKKTRENLTEILPTIIDGYKIYIGKNNRQNDIVTFKLSDKNDIWFHVQGFTGSHVLLKTNNKVIEDDNPIILKCAKLAALHSQANEENKVLIDYTLIKNIKKPKGAKPGFVIFNEYNSIIVNI